MKLSTSPKLLIPTLLLCVPTVQGNTPDFTAPTIDRVLHQVDDSGALWARGITYKSRFDADGAAYLPRFGPTAPRNFPVELHIDCVTLDGTPLSFDHLAAPVRTDDRITYDRGTFIEAYDLSLDHMEQSFVFTTLPTRGELVVRIHVTTDLPRRALADRIELENELGKVSYSRAIAIDHTGTRTDLDTSLADDFIEIRIPAHVMEHSVLPLVIDPVIASTPSILGHPHLFLSGDVARDATSGRRAVVAEYDFSAGDHDVAIWIEDANGSGSIWSIDSSSEDWRHPKIAADERTGRFLVVAERDAVGGDREIASARVALSGPIGAHGIISIGLAGDNSAPDIGGDFQLGTTSAFGVVWQRQYDIYFAPVDAGSGAPLYSLQVATTAFLESNPSISKGTGDASNGFQGWNVVWQRGVGPNNSDIWGAQISRSGSIFTPPFQIDGSSSDDTKPSASTCLSRTNGVDAWMATWERDAGANRKNVVAAVINGQSVMTTADLSVLEGFDASQDQLESAVDSDGRQFVVAYMESYAGSSADYDIYVSQFAFAGGALWPTEVHQALTTVGPNEAEPEIAADRSGGGTGTCASVVWYEQTTPNSANLRLGRYCGQQYGTTDVICAGNGTSPACPCGSGSAGHGCPNSVNPFGAALEAQGHALLSADTLVLKATGMPSTASCLFFQGTNVTNTATFGDGLRCVGGSVIRLSNGTSAGGTVNYPASGETAISVRGQVPLAGGMRAYQVWYRNAAAFCTSATFNLTNGLRIVWLP